MAVCSVQTLLDTDPCLSALSPHMLEVVITSMLCSLKDKLENGTEVSCDIQTLLDDGKCFYQLSDYQLSILQAQLLCEILNLS